jgi:hypothetical protein
MQKLRERKLGIPAASVATGAPAGATTDGSSARGRGGGGPRAAGEAGNEDLVLQDTFAQETAVTIEDPNMCVVSLCGYFCQCDGSPCYHLLKN